MVQCSAPTHRLLLPVRSRSGTKLLALPRCHPLLCLAASGGQHGVWGSFSSSAAAAPPSSPMAHGATPCCSTSDCTLPMVGSATPHGAAPCPAVPPCATLQRPTTLPCIPPCHTVPPQPQPRHLCSVTVQPCSGCACCTRVLHPETPPALPVIPSPSCFPVSKLGLGVPCLGCAGPLGGWLLGTVVQPFWE